MNVSEGESIKDDIRRYSYASEIIQRKYQNGEYNSKDSQIAIEWLRKMRKYESFLDGSSNMLANIFGYGAFFALAIPIGQAFYWLYSAEWYQLDFLRVMHFLGFSPLEYFPSESWLGLRKICEWYFSLHVSLHLLFYAVIVTLLLQLITLRISNLIKPKDSPQNKLPYF